MNGRRINRLLRRSLLFRMSSSLLIEPDEAGLQAAAALLRSGELLAFPTETVYGLGANALNVEAVLNIFKAKGRPLTDPLIVHVARPADAADLIEVSDAVRSVFSCLADRFWPGPLTIITKASALIPLMVTANTGFVGIRCPNHDLARRLIAAAGVPVAAPSANRFGHVSPTRAQHVLDDLAEKGVRVLNGESALCPQEACCQFGIESSVIKINPDTNEVWIYRQGAVTQSQLEDCLRSAGVAWTVKAVQRTVPMHSPAPETVTAIGEEAPGQSVTHYAPDVCCYMVKAIRYTAAEAPESFLPVNATLSLQAATVAQGAVMIDFSGQYASIAHTFLAYRDLSPSGSTLQAAQGLFDSLRWTETVSGAKVVLIAPVLQQALGQCEATDMSMGLMDRVHRAASGVAVEVVVMGSSSS